MKSNITIKKAMLKITTVLVSFILISLTVNAQDIWEELISNNQIKTISLALTEIPKEKETTSSDKNLSSTNFFISYEELVEESLELETWMISETFFPTIAIFEEEVSMELESLIKNNAEQKLELEKWMTDDKIWKK